jgi:hypothetical protein
MSKFRLKTLGMFLLTMLLDIVLEFLTRKVRLTLFAYT